MDTVNQNKRCSSIHRRHILVSRLHEELRERINKVLTCVSEFDFHLHPEKCQFFLPSVKYLGFIFNHQVQLPYPQNISVYATTIQCPQLTFFSWISESLQSIPVIIIPTKGTTHYIVSQGYKVVLVSWMSSRSTRSNPCFVQTYSLHTLIQDSCGSRCLESWSGCNDFTQISKQERKSHQDPWQQLTATTVK